jgi:hypothetical protein
MGAGTAALLELNDHWIAYLRWRKGEAENRLRATGDLDEVLAGLGGAAAPGPVIDEAAAPGAGLSPWAAAAPADGAALAAWDVPGGDPSPDGAGADPAAPDGLWGAWAAAGEPEMEEAEAPR